MSDLIGSMRSRNVRNVGGVARHAETAHIPGGGPAGETCLGCVHYIATTRPAQKKGRCWLAANMRGIGYRFAEIYRMANPDWWRGLGTISGKLPACKYWSRAVSRKAERSAP